MEGPHSVVRPAAGAGWVQAGAGKGVRGINATEREKGRPFYSSQSNFICQATVVKKKNMNLVFEM